MWEFCTTHLLPTMVVGAIFLVGLISTVLPILPSALIMWAGVLLHKLWVPEESVSWFFFIVITALVLLSQVLDWILSYWGVKKFGGTWKGGVGAIIGIIIGPFVLTPIVGFILGPILGAVIGELVGGNGFNGASRAGLGTVVGGIIAFILKISIVFIVFGGFIINVFLCG